MSWKAVDECKAHHNVISPAASCFIQQLMKKKNMQLPSSPEM